MVSQHNAINVDSNSTVEWCVPFLIFACATATEEPHSKGLFNINCFSSFFFSLLLCLLIESARAPAGVCVAVRNGKWAKYKDLALYSA